MFYSPTCQYALRALINLAVNEGKGPVSGMKIAEEEKIPKQFLAKILHDLRNRGLVLTSKGPKGGYQLGKPAMGITINDVVEAIDGKIELNSFCVLGLDNCEDDEGCELHLLWKKFRIDYMDIVCRMTLDVAAVTVERKRGR